MKYNDYPLPTPELVNVLNQEYKSIVKVKSLNVCKVGVLEQKSKLTQLYIYLLEQQNCLNNLKKLNKNLELKFNIQNHLNILEGLGVEVLSVKTQNNLTTCFADFLKTEAEILKLLMFLILLDNLSFNKEKLTQILTEQLETFNAVVNA